MRIALVNLTRFGDLLQTQAAVSGLRAAGHEPVMICLEVFQTAVGQLRGLAGVHLFPSREFADLSGPNWRDALARLTRWKHDLFYLHNPERVAVITPSLTARLLGRYLAGDGRIWGFGLDHSGFSCNSTPWAVMMQAAAHSRLSSPFNVVDLFRKCAGDATFRADTALARPDEDLLAAAQELLVQRQEAPGGYLAFQLGASEARRQWPVESFRQVGGRLWREHGICPVLTGVPSEKTLAAAYREGADHPVVDLTGETTVAELAAVLCHCRALVTNDTGTMHLAAGLRVPVLAVFLATAQPWDTGPAGPDCCSLEPDLDCHPCAFGTECTREGSCRNSITPAAIASLLDGYLRRGEWAKPDSPLAGVRVWKTVFGEDGLLDLHSLSGHDREDRTAWLRMQRQVFRCFLDEEELSLQPVTLSEDFRTSLAGELDAALLLLDTLIRQEQMLRQSPVGKVRQNFLAGVDRLARYLTASRHCASLSLFWRDEVGGAGAFDQLAPFLQRYRSLFQTLRQAI